jgi:S-adenosylmethionine synthetase
MTNIAEENLDRESEFEDSRGEQANGFVRNMIPIDMNNVQQEEEMDYEYKINMILAEYEKLQYDYQNKLNQNQNMKEMLDYARQSLAVIAYNCSDPSEVRDQAIDLSNKMSEFLMETEQYEQQYMINEEEARKSTFNYESQNDDLS